MFPFVSEEYEKNFENHCTRLKNDYPNIILWHCLNHRLKLILDDSVNDIKQMNHFKIFMDKIYTIFHQSNKNQFSKFQKCLGNKF